MKKSLLFLGSLFLALNLNAQLDTIANPGFERWDNMGTYDAPQQWNTLNPLTNALGTVVAFKVSGGEARTGNALKLVSKTILGSATASLATTGTVDVASQSVIGGVPINSRPLAFGGWYKYDPANSDTATFVITLTKWNGTSTEVVGIGAYQATIAVSDYTNFIAPVSYNSSAVPDTVQLLIVSSGQNYANVGTTLYADDLYYDFSTGIAENKLQGVELYPNPANDIATLKFNVDNNQSISIDLYNTLGQQVRSIYAGQTGNGLNKVDFSTEGLSAGVYVVKLAVGTKTYTQQLIVK